MNFLDNCRDVFITNMFGNEVGDSVVRVTVPTELTFQWKITTDGISNISQSDAFNSSELTNLVRLQDSIIFIVTKVKSLETITAATTSIDSRIIARFPRQYEHPYNLVFFYQV